MSEQQQPFVMEMDLTETPAWGGEDRPLVPAGDYTVTIVGFERKDASTGTPMIVVTYEVQDEGDWKDAKIWNNYPLTDNAKGRIKQLQLAVGASLNKIDSEEFMGATLMVTVIHVAGKAKIDSNGATQPGRDFANTINERAVAAPQPAATAKVPPVTKGAPVAQNTKPANNSAPRRA